MQHKTGTALTAIGILGLSLAAQAQDGERYITLASTTSTEASGLFGAIIPSFTEATGIEVRVVAVGTGQAFEIARRDRKSTRLNSSHVRISYAVFCLKKKIQQ